MPALPTPDKKLLQLRKRLCEEDLDEYFDGLWQVELRVERSKRSGSGNERREVLAQCACFGTEKCYRHVAVLIALWSEYRPTFTILLMDKPEACQMLSEQSKGGTQAVLLL